MPVSLPRGVQVSPYEKAIYSDFTGGLDYVADEHALDAKYSPDSENVDFLPGGGVRSRKVVAPFHTDDWTTGIEGIGARVLSLGRYETDTGSSYVMMGTSHHHIRAVLNGGGASTDVLNPGGVSTNTWRGCQINDKWYVVDGRTASRVWNGTTWTTLGQTFNDNEAAPDDGDMPIADFIAYYHGRCILARTIEAGVSYPSRVRFSHAVVQGKGEQDWKTNAYADLAVGNDGQGISAMVTNGQALFIFKQSSVYQMTGFDPTDLSFNTLDATIGTPNPDAVVATESAVYFWDLRMGLCRITRTPIGSSVLWQVEPISSRILDLIRSGVIDNSRSDEFAVGSDGDRVWVTVPWTEGETRVLVLDLRTGGWTRYKLNLGPYLNYIPVNGPQRFIAFNRDATRGNRVLILGVEGETDDFGSGPVPFQSYWRTAWLHNNLPHTPKRWVWGTIVLETRGNLTLVFSSDWSSGNTIGSTQLGLDLPLTVPFTFGTSGFPTGALERLTPDAPLTAVPDQLAKDGEAVFQSDHPYADDVDFPIPAAKQRSSEAIQVLLVGPSGFRWVVNSLSLNYWVEAKQG